MRRVLVVGITCGLAVLGTCAAAETPIRADTHRRIAVLVGVDRYQDSDIDRDLHGCANDVAKMADVLARRFMFTPVTLINDQATKENVLAALSKAADDAREDAQVVFYFSGYGSLDGNGKPSLCPHDAFADNAQNDIFAGQLWEWVDALGRKGATPLVLLDCCFAEPEPEAIAMGPRIRPKCLERGRRAGAETAQLIEGTLKSLVEKRGVLLTACGPGEMAREAERGGEQWIGVFTRFCAEELGGYPYDQKVTYDDLAASAGHKMERYVADVFYGDTYLQTPSVYGRKDLVLFQPDGEKPVDEPERETNRVRLRVAVYGQIQEDREELVAQLRQMPHVVVVEREEDADQSLFVFDTGADVQGYLVSSAQQTVESAFAIEPGDYGVVIDDVNSRMRGLLAYRWAGELPGGSSPSLQLGLSVTDEHGTSVRKIAAGDGGMAYLFVNLDAPEDQECYVTLYAISPSGGWCRILPQNGDHGDSVKLGAGEHYKAPAEFYAPQRWRLLAIAKTDPDVPSDQILRAMWDATENEYRKDAETRLASADVNGAAGGSVAMGTSVESLVFPVPPDIFADTPMGPSLQNADYAAAAVDVTVTY